MLLLYFESVAVCLFVVDLNALLYEVLLFLVTNLVFCAMPNVNSVFLSILIVKLGPSAKNEHNLFVVQVLEVKYG